MDKKVTNKEIVDDIFTTIKKLGFEPYNVEKVDGYFLFSKPEDSVTHFRLKGMWKHWKFGLWVDADVANGESKDEDAKYVASIFCQHDHNIDKFKPSASVFCVRFDSNDYKQIKDRHESYDLRDMLGMIKNHPFASFYYDAMFCLDYSDERFIPYFIKKESKRYWQDFKEKFMVFIFVPYTKMKLFFIRKSKFVESATVKKSSVTTPLYYAVITFKNDYKDDDCISLLNRFFLWDNYGMFNGYFHEYAVGLDAHSTDYSWYYTV